MHKSKRFCKQTHINDQHFLGRLIRYYLPVQIAVQCVTCLSIRVVLQDDVVYHFVGSMKIINEKCLIDKNCFSMKKLGCIN